MCVCAVPSSQLKTNDILSSNNLIAKLKKKLEQCEAAVSQHQRKIDKARLDLREQTKELGQVLFSVENVYNRCNNARHHEGRAQIIQHGKREEADNARPADVRDVSTWLPCAHVVVCVSLFVCLSVSLVYLVYVWHACVPFV